MKMSNYPLSVLYTKIAQKIIAGISHAKFFATQLTYSDFFFEKLEAQMKQPFKNIYPSSIP